MSKYKELSRNTLLFTVSSFGSRLISFLLVPLYTYVLSTEEYGTVDILNTTISLLIPLLTVNIQDAVLRFALDKEYNPETVIASGTRLITFSSLILAAVVAGIRVLGILSIGWDYALFFMLSFTFTAFQNNFSMYLRARDRVSTIVVSGLLTTLLTCGFSLLFLLVFKFGVTGYLFAHVFASFSGLTYSLLAGKIYKEISKKAKYDTLKLMVLYSSPLVANSLAWWLNDASDRYILTLFCGAAVNGVYAIAYKMPTILSTVQSIFYNAWSISAIKEFDADDKDGFVGNIYSLYGCVSLVSCSLLLLANPLIARILYSKDFFEAWRYAPILLVGAMFNGLSLFEGCLFTAVKRTKDVSKTTLIGAGVNTALNFVLIPLLGAYGAAIATLIGYLIVWITRTISLRSIIKIRVSWVEQIIGYFLLIGQGILATIGSNTTLIQIVVFALVLYVQRKFISETLKFVLEKMNRNKKGCPKI